MEPSDEYSRHIILVGEGLVAVRHADFGRRFTRYCSSLDDDDTSVHNTTDLLTQTFKESLNPERWPSRCSGICDGGY